MDGASDAEEGASEEDGAPDKEDDASEVEDGASNTEKGDFVVDMGVPDAEECLWCGWRRLWRRTGRL